MPFAQLVNCATNKMRKEETMGRAMAKRVKKMACPSCGASIHFRHDKNSIGTCPECGEWLVKRSGLRSQLDVYEDESRSNAFDESDEWERTLIDEIG